MGWFHGAATVGNPSIPVQTPPVTLRDELEVNLFSDLFVPVNDNSWKTFCIRRLCGGLGYFAALFVEYL